MKLNKELFTELFPKADPDLVPLINKGFVESNIRTPERAASFLAQCGHESAMFTLFKENLNYSSEGLLRVFPKYFDQVVVKQYARRPGAIANRVYADRMGNGPEQSGDGWRYRGRGLVQLTGKDNYWSYAVTRGLPFITIEEHLECLRGIVDSAFWYWDRLNLNLYADIDDIKAQTKRINGGYNGLEHRLALYNHIKNKVGR